LRHLLFIVVQLKKNVTVASQLYDVAVVARRWRHMSINGHS